VLDAGKPEQLPWGLHHALRQRHPHQVVVGGHISLPYRERRVTIERTTGFARAPAHPPQSSGGSVGEDDRQRLESRRSTSCPMACNWGEQSGAIYAKVRHRRCSLSVDRSIPHLKRRAVLGSCAIDRIKEPDTLLCKPLPYHGEHLVIVGVTRVVLRRENPEHRQLRHVGQMLATSTRNCPRGGAGGCVVAGYTR
jgi:hypothetical protein